MNPCHCEPRRIEVAICLSPLFRAGLCEDAEVTHDHLSLVANPAIGFTGADIITHDHLSLTVPGSIGADIAVILTNNTLSLVEMDSVGLVVFHANVDNSHISLVAGADVGLIGAASVDNSHLSLTSNEGVGLDVSTNVDNSHISLVAGADIDTSVTVTLDHSHISLMAAVQAGLVLAAAVTNNTLSVVEMDGVGIVASATITNNTLSLSAPTTIGADEGVTLLHNTLSLMARNNVGLNEAAAFLIVQTLTATESVGLHETATLTNNHISLRATESVGLNETATMTEITPPTVTALGTAHTSTNGGKATITLATSVPAGATLVVIASLGGTNHPVVGAGQLSDTGSNAYTLEAHSLLNGSNANGDLGILVCQNCNALNSGDKIQYTNNGGSSSSLSIAAYAVENAPTTISTATANGGGTAASVTLSGLNASKNTVLFGATSDIQITAVTGPFGWTNTFTQDGNWPISLETGYQIADPLGVTSMTYNTHWTGSAANAAAILALQ